jgi:hypothetical protein
MVGLISVIDEVCGRVYHINVVGVDVDALEANYQDGIIRSWIVYHV